MSKLANYCVRERATHLFRVSTTITEKGMRPDEKVIEVLEERGLRVHDLYTKEGAAFVRVGDAA